MASSNRFQTLFKRGCWRCNVYGIVSNFSRKISFNSPNNILPPAGPSLQRSFMYVPADKEDKLQKMSKPKPGALSPDILVLNCEDGVAMDNKELARSNLVSLLNDDDLFSSMKSRSQVSVRVNSAESGLAENDLRAVMSCKHLPQMISLPKVDSVDHLKWLSSLIKDHLKGTGSSLLVMAFIESARAVVDLVDICRYACSKESNLPYRLQGLIFGSDDYCHSIGVSRTDSKLEVLYPRQQIVTTAKAFNLSAIDMVSIDVKDLEHIGKDCLEGVTLGFSGKQVIHPAQLPAVHSAFCPSMERVKWARELLAEVEHTGGTGALLFRGQMIDEPTVLQARRLDELATSIAERDTKH